MSQSMDRLSLSEQLAFSTVQIIVELKEGYGTGTGFFFSFLEDNSGSIPVIVTNKHVIAGAIKGTFILSTSNPDGSPNTTSHIPVVLDNFEARWILHPDSNVDLAIMPIAPLLNEAKIKKVKPYYKKINKDLIPSDGQLKD